MEILPAKIPMNYSRIEEKYMNCIIEIRKLIFRHKDLKTRSILDIFKVIKNILLDISKYIIIDDNYKITKIDIYISEYG